MYPRRGFEATLPPKDEIATRPPQDQAAPAEAVPATERYDVFRKLAEDRRGILRLR